MTVLEVSPGGGWYTEVLAPLLSEQGTLIAGHGSPNGSAYSRRSLVVTCKSCENNDIYSVWTFKCNHPQPPSMLPQVLWI